MVEKEKASMIVMGSKGATGLRHLLLGSVAETGSWPCQVARDDRQKNKQNTELRDGGS